MSSKPTVILVPGAWHTEHTYHKLVPDLERRGYKTRAIRNPSLGKPAADGLVEKDAEHLRSVIDPYLAAGTDVIVAAHSYGGGVLSPALADYSWKKDEGGKGRVLGLVYIAAFILPEGKTFAQTMYPPNGESNMKADENGFLPPPDPHVFYNDLPESEQRELYAGLLPQPGNIGTEVGRGAPWQRVPTVYVKTAQDIILPADVQQRMVDAVEGGEKMRVVLLDSSHSPMLSMPEKVGDAVALAEELGRARLAEEGLA
ncbi:microsomal signal peptidase 12kda subunit [Diplodia corticola]|uniref:Microsomal signal peptidase 12kda subunit n=1 Tax=Diplodia corticola TaxID=236234 RepID=A0A1J9QTA2_9PEZI|nr:microsomal signal peptidase 12kda subunit [Diplodia corticola]OJD31633.1 microsomal signal peptidase 12kda subunit [Diplodia corticola]